MNDTEFGTVFRWLVFVTIIALAVAVFAALCPAVLLGQPPALATQHYRDTLTANDPDRDWSIVWTRGDATSDRSFGFFTSGDGIWEPVKVGGLATRAFVPRETDWYEQCHWRSFRLPIGIVPGVHRVTIGTRDLGTITVVTAKRPVKVLTNRYVSDLVCTPNTKYSGYGATLIGNVTLAEGVTIEGLTVVDGTTQGTATNAVIRDCRFIRGQFGGMVDWSRPKEYADHGALYQDCVFERCQVSGCCSGCFLNCRFQGLATGSERIGHSFTNERAKRLVMVNCVFDGTDRGPILRNQWGDSSDNLYAGLHFLNINSVTNGNEIFCIESNVNRFDRNMIFGVRAFNCTNHLQIWDTKADGNLIANSLFGSGCTVNISGLEVQRWNQVRYCELSAPILVNRDGNRASDTKDTENKLRTAQ